MGYREMKKIFLIILFFIENAYGNNTSTTMTVTVKVIENYEKNKIINANYLINENKITITNNQPIVLFSEKNGTTTTNIIREIDYNCCYCTQKYSDGTYIDEEKNSYLFDKRTNKIAINYLNQNTGKVIFCPKINIKK